MSCYRGRFAPSPTGLLHPGSLVAALASWLDARAHQGQWLVRIEDTDTPRCVPGAAECILQQLATCGLFSDEDPVWQSKRESLYAAALHELQRQHWVYPCTCSRKTIAAAVSAQGQRHVRHGDWVYPGMCRPDSLYPQTVPLTKPHAWRFDVAAMEHALQLPPDLNWHDRRLGAQSQQVCEAVGDFVLRRADGLWAYQLAVVVDDAAQGITHVVRGADLADNTARQVRLQQALGYAQPEYLHTPLVCGSNGEKLSKQNGAQAVDLSDPVTALNQAAHRLGLPCCTGSSITEALGQWVNAWRQSFPLKAGTVNSLQSLL